MAAGMERRLAAKDLEIWRLQAGAAGDVDCTDHVTDGSLKADSVTDRGKTFSASVAAACLQAPGAAKLEENVSQLQVVCLHACVCVCVCVCLCACVCVRARLRRREYARMYTRTNTHKHTHADVGRVCFGD